MMELEEDSFYNTSHCLSSTEFPSSFELSFDTTPASSPYSASFPPVLGPDLEIKAESSKPGNAFSQFHVFEDCPRPRTSDTSSSPKNFFEFPDRSQTIRKISSMEFPTRTAIPRLSTRSSEVDSPKTPASGSYKEEVKAPATAQDHAVTDSVIAMGQDTPDHESLPDASEGKKKSRFNIIKAKLSFKDLRKESSKQESPKEPTPQSHRIPTQGAIPTPSSAVHGKKPNPSRGDKTSAPTIVPSANLENLPSQGPSTASTQLPQPISRIPLPPSGTLSNVSGTLSRSRRSSGWETRAKNSPDFTAIKDKLESAAGPSSRVPSRRPVATTTSPSLSEAPSKKSLLMKSSTAHGHQGTKDPLTILPEPKFKEGIVKNLAKSFVEGSTRQPSEVQSKASLPPVPSKDESPTTPRNRRLPSDIYSKANMLPVPSKDESPTPSLPRRVPSGIRSKASLPTLHKKEDSLTGSLPRRLPSFQERLDKGDAPHSQGKQLETQSRTTASDVGSMIDMIHSIKTQMEIRTATIHRKYEDLSNWVGDQLKNQIQSSADLSRTNNDLFNKQCQISREMMKLQLDTRIEIGMLEQRLVDFEHRVLNEVQNEVRSLARAYNELNDRTELIIDKYSADNTQEFIEWQAQKNAEVDSEIAYLKARQGNWISTEIAPFAAQRVPTRRSLSTHGSHEPLIKDTSPPPALSYENIQKAHRRSHLIPSEEIKPPGAFPRSVSITKKGLLKGIKDIASNTSDPSKEKSPEARKPSEETKKWTMFGLRRRRNPSERESSGMFNWSPRTRRMKDMLSPDAASSRSSSPPIPPVPREIPRGRSYPIPSFTSEEIHPAFRDSAIIPLEQTTSYETGAAEKLHSDLDNRVSTGSTDTFGRPKPRFRTSADGSRFTEELSPVYSEQMALTPDTVIHRTLTEEENEQKEFNDTAEQDWDHVSVEESKTEDAAH